MVEKIQPKCYLTEIVFFCCLIYFCQRPTLYFVLIYNMYLLNIIKKFKIKKREETKKGKGTKIEKRDPFNFIKVYV